MDPRASGRFALLLLLGATACQQQEPGTPDSAPRLANAPAPGESPVDRPHVAFTANRLIIPRLGLPTSAPMSVTSLPSPDTLRSEDPAIVSVTRDGLLLGMRAGRTRVFAAPWSTSLEVEVKALSGIAVVPGVLVVEPGRSANLSIFDPETDEVFPAAEAEWISDKPTVAAVREGRVDAGDTVGSATIRVRYAGYEVRAEVTVTPSGEGGLVLSPTRARMRLGEVRLFQAASRSGPLAATWESRNPAVVALVHEGLVQALSPGRTSICATAQGRQSCSKVEVTP